MSTAAAILLAPLNHRAVAMCPRTGAVLRNATADEVDAYVAQPEKRPLFRRPVRLGEVTITEVSNGRGNAPYSCGEN